MFSVCHVMHQVLSVSHNKCPVGHLLVTKDEHRVMGKEMKRNNREVDWIIMD